ncbi:MAG TPA: hypothetical protein VFD73_16655, partial [Gemmatimonadales bacterium]|nr:hypothetical protein [Gemmatimonadales bacterium]
MNRALLAIVLPVVMAAGAVASQANAQTGRAPHGTFRFSHEAGLGLQALWQESIATRQERVACMASTIRNDTVFVTRIAMVKSEEADSLGISARASVEQCGPPAWSGTVHTHIALYSDSLPSTRFSAQDRAAMR